MEIIGAQNIIKIKEIVDVSVQAQCDEILSQANLECEKIKASSDSGELCGAIENISAEKKRISEHYKSLVAKSQRDCATKYLALRSEYTDGVFEKVKLMLCDYVKSDAYPEYLKKCVENEPCGYTVLLCADDMKYADIFNANCQICEDIKIGGIMLRYDNERKIIDKSFDSKLEAYRETFLEKYGKLLCGGEI